MTVAKLMNRYTTDNLVGITPEKFQKHIMSQIGSVDYEVEGYTKKGLAKQRDLSVKFRWGHNHNFGSFKLGGQMGNRHIKLMDNFCKTFPIKPADFKGKRVLDIGCWSGGTTLLLKALGADVVAVEEVRKYANMTKFLLKSFGHNDPVISESLYKLDFKEEFDIIYFPGVLYHLTDPVVALRILYNACKVGGTIVVESAGLNNAQSVCQYQGCTVYHGGSKGTLNRGGWNWFVPSYGAMKLMVENVGFEGTQAGFIDRRAYAYGVKKRRNDMTRAGLSRPDIL